MVPFHNILWSLNFANICKHWLYVVHINNRTEEFYFSYKLYHQKLYINEEFSCKHELLNLINVLHRYFYYLTGIFPRTLGYYLFHLYIDNYSPTFYIFSSCKMTPEHDNLKLKKSHNMSKLYRWITNLFHVALCLKCV